MNKIHAALLLAAAIGIAHAQTVVATIGSGQTSIPLNFPRVAFVTSNADTVEAATTQAPLSGVGKQIGMDTVGKMIPIPIFGPLARPIVKIAMNRLRPPKPVTGFSIAFLPGLSSANVLQSRKISFTLPPQSLQGSSPFLLQLKPSAKDSTRIVRSVHLCARPMGNTIDPNPANIQILGVEQNVRPCNQTDKNGSIVLTPTSPLEAGEYAVVLVPSQNPTTPAGMVWDFRIAQ